MFLAFVLTPSLHTTCSCLIIIIIIASHDNEMNEIYNDKIYMRRSDTMK